MAEIANRVGIDSPQSFTKFFTQEFGSSPTEYRKTNAVVPSESLLKPIEAAHENGQANTPVDLIPDEPLTDLRQSLPSLKKRRIFLLAGLITLLFLFIGLGLYVGPINRESRSEPSPNAIAVLPFTNLGSSETAFFADGRKVISKASSMLFRDTQKTIPAIASELGVQYLLTGTVAQTSNHIRISVKLIQANEDQTVWTTNYDGDARNAAKFMNDVSKTIVQKLSQSTTNQIDKLPTKNWEAYNAYLEGQKPMQSREKAKLEASIQKFNRAIALDTSFADAYAYRASAYFIMVSFFFMDQSVGVKLAEQSALDAMGTGPDELSDCPQAQSQQCPDQLLVQPGAPFAGPVRGGYSLRGQSRGL